MKRLFFIVGMAFVIIFNTNAQSFKETFDANSLEWTECAYDNDIGTAIIKEGKMIVTSKGEHNGHITHFETHCYAPLNVLTPFRIRAHVNIEKLDNDKLTGMVFNYKDGGNFYCFNLNSDMVRFDRFVDGELVGTISQGVKWKDKKKVDQEWELTSDGQVLTFVVDGVQILKVRYMPLEYTGFGFYAYGKQVLKVDDVEFIQF